MSEPIEVFLACYVLAAAAAMTKQYAFPPPAFKHSQAIWSSLNAAFTALANSMWIYQVPGFGPIRTIATAILCGLGWAEFLNLGRTLIVKTFQQPGGGS
jgi:hypothetical protein